MKSKNNELKNKIFNLIDEAYMGFKKLHKGYLRRERIKIIEDEEKTYKIQFNNLKILLRKKGISNKNIYYAFKSVISDIYENANLGNQSVKEGTKEIKKNLINKLEFV